MHVHVCARGGMGVNACNVNENFSNDLLRVQGNLFVSKVRTIRHSKVCKTAQIIQSIFFNC